MGKVAVVSLEFMVPDLCVACGGPALPKKRRVVKDEVGVIWAKISQKEATTA